MSKRTAIFTIALFDIVVKSFLGFYFKIIKFKNKYTNIKYTNLGCLTDMQGLGVLSDNWRIVLPVASPFTWAL